MIDFDKLKICIVGLGYVGLPLAVEFGKKFPVVGFDISDKRINELKRGIDSTFEVSSDELNADVNIRFTHDIKDIMECNCYVVTVPTPIDKYKVPDLSPLISASSLVGSVLESGNIIIYESTVYPGCTLEQCVPILEKISGFSFNKDFYVGYSPERINPGDKTHKLTTIKKIVSGSTPEALTFVDNLYSSIISAGTHSASSIEIAEAAKVIENTQRDINIALINEFALIFNKMNIDTASVLEAAATKWNFLPFKPGLVGGHCIGVDPYYLTYKAESIGYYPQIILAGRRLNDSMATYVASRMVKTMMQKNIQVHSSRLLVMGLSFKENCPDIRNTKVVDLIAELKQYRCRVDVYDPWVRSEDAYSEYGLTLVTKLESGIYDGIIIAVAHHEFLEMGIEEIKSLGSKTTLIYDLKNIFQSSLVDIRL